MTAVIVWGRREALQRKTSTFEVCGPRLALVRPTRRPLSVTSVTKPDTFRVPVLRTVTRSTHWPVALRRRCCFCTRRFTAGSYAENSPRPLLCRAMVGVAACASAGPAPLVSDVSVTQVLMQPSA